MPLSFPLPARLASFYFAFFAYSAAYVAYFPLYLAGARLVSMVPLGPPIEGAGLNITVLSYIDRIDWGFIVCRELVPRLQDMAHGVEDAHRELMKAAGL